MLDFRKIISGAVSAVLLLTAALPVNGTYCETVMPEYYEQNMTRVDDEGILKNFLSQNTEEYAVYLSEQNGRISLVKPLNDVMEVVFKEDVSLDRAYEEIARLADSYDPTVVDIGMYEYIYCDSPELNDYFDAFFEERDGRIWAKVVCKDESLRTDEVEAKFMNALDVFGLIDEFYGFGDVYNPVELEGYYDRYVIDENSDVKEEDIQKCLDENFSGYCFMVTQTEVYSVFGENKLMWYVSSAHDVVIPFSVYFNIYVKLNKEFGLTAELVELQAATGTAYGKNKIEQDEELWFDTLTPRPEDGRTSIEENVGNAIGFMITGLKDGQTMTYKLSDETVGRLESADEPPQVSVEGLKEGTTVLTAESSDGRSFQVEIKFNAVENDPVPSENEPDEEEPKTVEPYFIVGDVNGDKEVDSRDATALLIKYAEALNDNKTIKAEELPAGDFNGDGEVNSLDATDILLAYAERLIKE